MSEQLGNESTIYVSSDGGGSYSLLGEVFDPSMSIPQDLHDTTINGGGGWKRELKGHKQLTLSVSCHYDESDVAQEKVLSAMMDGTDLHWKIRPRGDQTGYKEYLCEGNLESHDVTMTTQGPMDFPVSMRSTGTVTRQNQP